MGAAFQSRASRRASADPMSHTPILTIVPLIGNQKRKTLLWKNQRPHRLRLRTTPSRARQRSLPSNAHDWTCLQTQHKSDGRPYCPLLLSPMTLLSPIVPFLLSPSGCSPCAVAPAASVCAIDRARLALHADECTRLAGSPDASCAPATRRRTDRRNA